jgi:multiple sugar transport system permease protein
MNREQRTRLFWTIGTIIIVFYALIPVAWIASLSLKKGSQLTDGNFLPSSVSFKNYTSIFDSGQFTSPLRNSIGIALLTTFFAVLLATFAAYAIARLDFPGKVFILSGALAIAMFPPISIIGPLFNMWRSLHLYDTWPGLIIPYMTFALPLAIWTMSAFFREIPWELEQAAQVDGATPFQAFRKVILPLAAPALFTTAILVFLQSWNEYLLSSVLSNGKATVAPSTVAIANFTAGPHIVPYTQTMAAGLVVTVPLVIVVLVFQRRIVSGLTAGGVKG